MATILLLVASNIFMTIAWYWHLGKDGLEKPILTVILLSWLIAGVEYCFAVPANRVGYLAGWTPGQLKMAQEAIALTVFGVFMVTVLGEALHWRHAAAFACIMAGVAFLFVGK
ncbi:DMT family protein [Sphingomonas sp.]|uniref:DMT family protein n=1 Tax=Sphingomonas sp. TaxID=28214 RepID=UPI002ED9DAF9